MKNGKTLLIFSQVFIPDPASVGQHIADVAIEMARRGYKVKVITSARGYENPNVKYPPHEFIQGVEVCRLGLASFGKKSIFTRVLGTASFMLQCISRALFTPNVGGIFFSTSPPLIGIVPCLAKFFRRIPIVYWAMDLNPDQLIMMGKITEKSFTARGLDFINKQILKRSDWIFALDRFMADRLQKRGDYSQKTTVMPPWPHENNLDPVDQATNPFRLKHDLVGKFVVMYSGNHSPANPLKTLLEAAARFKDDPNIRFLFVGGGLGKKEVEAAIKDHGLTNVISLPYQPLADLRYSLSAADVHVVSLGQEMVGIIHPCKIYGAMAVGRPVLFFGPRPSHVSDILDEHHIGWQVAHGDVDGATETIRQIRALPPQDRAAMGAKAMAVLGENLSQQLLCDRMCTQLEKNYA